MSPAPEKFTHGTVAGFDTVVTDRIAERGTR